jgi:hypothetical protein
VPALCKVRPQIGLRHVLGHTYVNVEECVRVSVCLGYFQILPLPITKYQATLLYTLLTSQQMHGSDRTPSLVQ